MEWTYEGRIFEGPINGHEGFVYLIENLITNKKYVGKKHFWSRRREKRAKRRTKRESDWRNYYGSNDELLRDVEQLGEDKFTRVILRLCKYKKEMSFWEQKEQWDRNVLFSDGYYNSNIGGKFFVYERHIYEKPYKKIDGKNNNWRKAASERWLGEKNPAKREDVRAKISEKKKGPNHHQYGKPISEEHRKALVDGHKKWVSSDREVSAETRAKMSAAAKERIKRDPEGSRLRVQKAVETHAQNARLRREVVAGLGENEQQSP